MNECFGSQLLGTHICSERHLLRRKGGICQRRTQEASTAEGWYPASHQQECAHTVMLSIPLSDRSFSVVMLLRIACHHNRDTYALSYIRCTLLLFRISLPWPLL